MLALPAQPEPTPWMPLPTTWWFGSVGRPCGRGPPSKELVTGISLYNLHHCRVTPSFELPASGPPGDVGSANSGDITVPDAWLIVMKLTGSYASRPRWLHSPA